MIINADTDRFVREVIEGNEYSFLFKDLVVLDVGCNIGTFSLWIYELAKQIYAVDISKQNIERFNKTIRDNRLDRIKTYLCGIAGENGKRGVVAGGEPGNGGWKLSSGTGDVETYSLRSFMDMNNIDYVDVLKLDIEGTEEEALGAKDFPFDRVNTIVGEIHSYPGLPVFQELVERIGYRYIDLGGHFLARK